MALTTYSIDKMRVTRPKGKTAERHPERLATVTGVFYSTEQDSKGNLVRKDKLSIAVKYIDHEDKAATIIDLANGILTVPAGERGRKAEASLDQDAVNALLASVMTDPEPEPEPEPDTD